MHKLKLVFLILLGFFFNYIIAQSHFCCQAEVMNEWFKNNPKHKKSFLYSFHSIESLARSKSIISNSTRGPIKYAIPVVFHIIHLNGPENINNDQIFDQIRILNRDFQKLNADTNLIVQAFKNNIADVGFEFQLATIDPEGNCTNGIIRHYSSKTIWDANRIADFIFSWPSHKYLNVYVVRSINIAPAYTFLPGTPIPDFADAIVIQHNILGSIGTASVANSRALTHEVAHWFGIPHIWGFTNAPGVSCGDDNVEDTPITKGFTSCAVNNSKICDPQIEENVQNYMDYSPCKIMFTQGQANFMYATIESGINGRKNLVSNQNLIETGVLNFTTCQVKADFYTNPEKICVGDLVKFYSQSQTGKSNKSLQWQFEGTSLNNSTDSIVELTYLQAGEYKVVLILNSSIGSDTITKLIKVSNSVNGQKTPFQYGFNNGIFPSDINIINSDNDEVFWEINNFVGANGSKGCFYLNSSVSSNTFGNEDYFETQFFDLTNASKPQLSFYYSYAKKFETQADIFRIEYSFDCGRTWRAVNGIPSLNTMASMTGGVQDFEYEPKDSSQWQKVLLSSSFSTLLKNKPSVAFRFYFKSDINSFGSNNLYIDEINLFDADFVNVDKLKKEDLTIYPNPTYSEFKLEFSNIQHLQSIQLLNLEGKLINVSNYRENEEDSIRINSDKKLKPGIYFLKIYYNDLSTITKKLVVLSE